MEFSIQDISYEQIFPVWQKYLWPDRQDPIRPMSSMLLGGAYNMDIYKLYEPKFLGLFVGADLVGVLSGHRSSEQDYRIRGLYVFEEYRRRGGAQKLFAEMKKIAQTEGASIVWSYPRLDALSVYHRFGFRDHSSRDHDQDHVYVFLNAVI